MTRALKADEKRVYDLLTRTGGCTRYYLELHLTMTVREIANTLRRLTKHGYAKTGWPERSNHLWLPMLPTERFQPPAEPCVYCSTSRKRVYHNGGAVCPAGTTELLDDDGVWVDTGVPARPEQKTSR